MDSAFWDSTFWLSEDIARSEWQSRLFQVPLSGYNNSKINPTDTAAAYRGLLFKGEIFE